MNQQVRLMIASLTLAGLTAGIASPVLANPHTSDLRPMLVTNRPVPISADAAWRGHWAEPDLQALRASANLKPEILVNGAVDPEDVMQLHQVADVLTYIYGVGGESGNALELATKLGLIRPSDLAGSTIDPAQVITRERFALLLTRALGLNGAEDAMAVQPIAPFADADAIQPAYRAAATMMRAEGLMVGDGEGRFAPAQPVTFAQAAKMLNRASAWSQEKAAKLAGVDPANATYLIDGQSVTLIGGKAEAPAEPGAASRLVTRLTDRLAAGELTGDGKLDLAAVLTQETGGSGTFFYLAAVDHDGTPIEAAFLGDRIAVQNVRIVDGKVVVDLLTRGANEPFSVRPHIKESRVYEVKDGALVPVGVETAALSPAEATYLINGQTVTLTGGKAEQPAAPGSASKVVTRLTDRQATGDLNGDGKSDLAAVLTQETGGSGTFFYLAAVDHDGTPIEAAFLGDRIAVQNVRIVEGKVVVDLLTRGANEPFSVRPHIKESRVYEVKDGALVPVGVETAALSPAEATYLINGQTVTLTRGNAEQPAAPGSASKVVTRLTERQATGALSSNGKSDLAAVLTQETGGSGTFFYLAAVANDGTPIKAAFLGDRITVQNVQIVDGTIVVDLLTRDAKDPMTVQPHVKESRGYVVKDGALVLAKG